MDTTGLIDIDRLMERISAIFPKCRYVSVMAGVPAVEMEEILIKRTATHWKVSSDHGHRWERLSHRQLKARFGAGLFRVNG